MFKTIKHLSSCFAVAAISCATSFAADAIAPKAITESDYLSIEDPRLPSVIITRLPAFETEETKKIQPFDYEALIYPLAQGLDPFTYPRAECERKRSETIAAESAAVGGVGIKIRGKADVFLGMPNVSDGRFPVMNIMDDYHGTNLKFFSLWLRKAPADRPVSGGYEILKPPFSKPLLIAWGRGQDLYAWQNYVELPLMAFTNGEVGIPSTVPMGLEIAKAFAKGKVAPYRVTGEFFLEVSGVGATRYKSHIAVDIVRVIYRDQAGKIVADVSYPRAGHPPVWKPKPKEIPKPKQRK